jgi:hypothetical protein
MIEQARQVIALEESGNRDWEKVAALWNEVRDKHPRLFNDRDLGTSVGPGWWTLLDEAFSKIDALLDEHPGVTFKVVQIKEKFGGLRVYGDTSSDADDLSTLYVKLDAILDEAEQRAATTCEVCGEPGEQRYGSWIKVLCDKHDAERKKRYGLPAD